jgi:hypothetical protein
MAMAKQRSPCLETLSAKKSQEWGGGAVYAREVRVLVADGGYVGKCGEVVDCAEGEEGDGGAAECAIASEVVADVGLALL